MGNVAINGVTLSLYFRERPGRANDKSRADKSRSGISGKTTTFTA